MTDQSIGSLEYKHQSHHEQSLWRKHSLRNKEMEEEVVEFVEMV